MYSTRAVKNTFIAPPVLYVNYERNFHEQLELAHVFACLQSVQHQLLWFVHIMDNNYSVNYKVLIIFVL